MSRTLKGMQSLLVVFFKSEGQREETLLQWATSGELLDLIEELSEDYWLKMSGWSKRDRDRVVQRLAGMVCSAPVR